MRRVGLACLLAGLLGAVVYPIWVSTYNNIELGTYRVFDAAGGYRTIADVSLSPAAEPLLVTLIGSSQAPPSRLDEATIVTLVVNNAEGTVAAEVVTLASEATEFGPDAQAPQTFRVELPAITGLGNGNHDFVFGEGDRTDIPLAYLDMTLTAAVAQSDARIAPVSWALIALGVVLMIVFSRRRGRKRQAASQTPAKPESGRPATSNIGRRVPLDREPEPAKPESPKSEPRQWGRGDDA